MPQKEIDLEIRSISSLTEAKYFIRNYSITCLERLLKRRAKNIGF